MWVKQCHKPPIWEWFIQTIYGDDCGMVYNCFTHVTLSISPWEKKTSWDWTELPMNAMNAYATYGYGSIAMKIAFLGG